jgi:hypothetical protein
MRKGAGEEGQLHAEGAEYSNPPSRVNDFNRSRAGPPSPTVGMDFAASAANLQPILGDCLKSNTR